jgi:hypothetical protein
MKAASGHANAIQRAAERVTHPQTKASILSL